MRRRSAPPFATLPVVVLCLHAGAEARAAELGWTDSFPGGHVRWWVHAAAVFDEDGPGGVPPRLFAGGDFEFAGGIPVNRIARWDGERWSGVGPGFDGPVHALVVFDADGPGPARPVLVAGGAFATAGGDPARNVAAWDGSEWSALAEGLGGPNASVRALHVWHPDGAGPQGAVLVAGGRFDEAGIDPAGGLAVWNGEHWAALGAGTPSTVHALSDFGGELWAGGDFDEIDGAPIARLARFDGEAWTPGGTVLPAGGEILALAPWSPGSERGTGRLAIGGDFDSIDGVTSPNVTSFDGTAFLALGTGIGGAADRVEVMAPFDPDGSDATLWAGGAFNAGGLRNLARFDGTSWNSVGAVRAQGDGWVRALAPYDADRTGPGGRRLWIGGLFFWVNNRTTTSCACTWDGTRLLPLGNGVVWQMWSTGGNGTSFDPDGPGPTPPRLYVCGGVEWAGEVAPENGGAAAWTGTEWTDPGFAANDRIRRIEALDLGDGPELYTVGAFTEIGGVAAQHIAKWDGTNWSPLGGGIDATFADLEAWDRDGPGPLPPVLVAAGAHLDLAGGVAVDKVAQWDGSAWSDLGNGALGYYGVSGVGVFDEDGEGPSPPTLFAAKNMLTAPCIYDDWLLRLVDGLEWSSFGTGYGFWIPDLETFDPDEAGPEPEQLYLPVSFPCFFVEDPPAQALARWDGVSVQDLGFPHGAEPGPLKTVDLDGDGPDGPGLFACNVTGAYEVGRYDGATWEVVGISTQSAPGFLGPYSDLVEHDPDGAGPRPPVLVALGEFAGLRDGPGGDVVSSGGIGFYGDFSDPATSAPSGRPASRAPPGLLTAGRAIPTPARDAVRVELSLAREGTVRATVHDVQGRRVRRLLDGPLPSGRHVVTWDGRTSEGGSAASGVYFLRVAAHGETVARRIVRIE